MFQFKQFSISDENTAMKIGTDGILLGSWVNVDKATKILDIGAGTGVIAIMSAQKNQTAKITAIEIDDNAILDAHQNIQNCPWNNRILLIHTALQTYGNEITEQVDCIISNPPFFEKVRKHLLNHGLKLDTPIRFTILIYCVLLKNGSPMMEP